YISESRRMGLQIIGPDINLSRWGYYAQNNSVLIGFMAIANFSNGASRTIIAERNQHGVFTTLEDFAMRMNIQRDDLVALVAAGACDSLAPTLPRSEQLKRLLITTSTKGDAEGQGELFPHKHSHISPVHFQKPLPRTKAELQREFETLGFLRNYHPLLLWAHKIASIERIRAINVDKYINRYVQLIGWPITRKTIWTMQGLTMEFISFEDETALYETVVFPQIYATYHQVVYGQLPVVIRGKVCNEQGAVHIEVQSFRSIAET
ncbi:MAG: DNA polymerase III subunit alpha, partial [Sphaerochaetaceae bacterium]|nr:DNA polymerase III subunit alpha [Sphaerochaetaceae bacterium]